MYQHTQTAFGQWTKHTIADHNGSNRLSLVPGYGAGLLDLTLDGVSLLDVYDTPLNMDINRWCKNVLLFPFPNRLKEGGYHWEDNEYHFAINDTITNNALHGLGMNAEMDVESTNLQEESASITCRYDYPGDDPGYPFPFQLWVTFQIETGGRFNGRLQFANQSDQNIPVGLGWHPYFQLSDHLDQLELQLPSCEMVGVDSQMIPTGKRYAYDDFEELKKVGATVLDNCFALTANGATAEVWIKGNKGSIRFWQEAGPGKFNFMQIFTPPHRQSIAIEPMTCNIDAFNNGDGLVTLKPGEEWEVRFGMAFEK